MERRTALIRVSAWIAVAISAASILLWRTWAKVGQPAGAERSAYIESSGQTLPDLWDSPAFSLPNQQGNSVSKQDLRGHVWIADFIFTTCTAVCPRITASMVQLQNRLTDPGLRFVSFSVDPEHDTIAALAAYKQSWNADDGRWHLLRPSGAELQGISDGMRVALEPTSDMKNPILHSALFFLIDSVGKVRGVYDSGDDQALQRLVNDTQLLLAAASTGSASKATHSAPSGSGREIYAKLGCAACHDRSELAPSLVGLRDRPIALAGGKQVHADRAYIERSLLEPGAEVTLGYLQLMPSYKAELQGEALRLLVDYLVAGVDPPTTSKAAPLASTPANLPGAPTAPGLPQPGKGGPGTTATAPEVAPSVAATASPAAGVHVDPVCEMDVRASASTPHATHAGHTYYFCSPICRDRFVAEPEKYVPKK